MDSKIYVDNFFLQCYSTYKAYRNNKREQARVLTFN